MCSRALLKRRVVHVEKILPSMNKVSRLQGKPQSEAYELYGVSGVVGPGQSCLAGTEQHSELREDDRKWTRQAKSSRKSFCSFVIAWESTTGSDCTLRRMESSFSSRATILLSSSSLRCWSSNTRSYIMFWVCKATGRTVHSHILQPTWSRVIIRVSGAGNLSPHLYIHHKCRNVVKKN